MISIIVVIGKNKAIGCNNQLLWDIPEDMARFKELTMGHPVIMGRKTHESISVPLPGRCNIVISRDKGLKIPGCQVVSSLDEAIKYSKECNGHEEIFIIGGGEIYKQALAHTDKLYLTIVDDEPEADTFFPDYSEFTKILKKEENSNEKLGYTFLEISK